MGKNISEFTDAIIDGLGYEVVPGNGIQGVDFLKDKTTGEKLSSEKPQQIDGYETKIITGKDGEKIYLSETGSMELYFGNDIRFYVFPDLNCPGSVKISIEYKDKKLFFEYKDKELSFENNNFISNSSMINISNVEIFVGCSNSIYLYRSIVRMFYFEDSFGNGNDKFIPEECTDDNIIGYIIDRIQKYDGGSYWNDIFEAMLDVIKPALSLYAEEFRNDWSNFLSNIVSEEKNYQAEENQRIDKDIQIIEESVAREQNAINAMNALQMIPEDKKRHMS